LLLVLLPVSLANLLVQLPSAPVLEFVGNLQVLLLLVIKQDAVARQEVQLPLVRLQGQGLVVNQVVQLPSEAK
jgi:hypothetical protein